MSSLDHYLEYFRQLQITHGKLPSGEFGQLIQQQLAALREQLVRQDYPSEDLEREMAAATAAAAGFKGSVRPPQQQVRAGLASNWFHTGWMPKPIMLLLIGFATVYLTVLVMFLREGHPKITVTGIDADAIAMEVQFIGVDLVRETITLTIIPDMSVPAVANRGRLTSDVSVEIDTGVSLLAHTFKKGDAPIPWLATIPIEEGDQLEYPLDQYTGDFEIKVLKEGTNGIAPNLELDKIVHGFRMQAEAQPTADRTRLNVAYMISRSRAVIMLASLAMISLLLVVISAVNVAWQVTALGRKPEFSMMTWIAALLFVVPAVRNGLPGGPPPGALIDVALFFWLHVITAGSLLSVVWSWSRLKG